MDEPQPQVTMERRERPSSMVGLYLDLKDISDDFDFNPRKAYELATRRVVMAIGLLGSIRDKKLDEQIYPVDSEKVNEFLKQMKDIEISEVRITVEEQYTVVAIGKRTTPWRILRGTEATMYQLLDSQLYDKPRLDLAKIEAAIDNILYDYGILHPTENLESTGYVRFLEDKLDISVQLKNAFEAAVKANPIDEETVVGKVTDKLQAMIDDAVTKALKAGKWKK